MDPAKNNLKRAEAAARAAAVADVDYDIELDLTSEGDTFGSRTTARFQVREGSDTTAVFLDLTAPEVTSVTLDGEPVEVEHDGQRLRVAVHPGANEVVVEARCAYSRAGVGLHRFVDPVDGLVYLHTQFEPFDAHRVFACFDQPDLKARFSLRVTAPEGWVVVSNEPASDQPAGGEAGTWTFAPTPKLSTYLLAVVAGHYVGVSSSHGDLPLGLWCRRSLREHLDPDEFFEITRQGLDHFTELFGMPYPFTKYDQLLVPEFNAGAMENPGCVTFHEGYVFRSRVTDAARESRAGTILHEMAHMWFGDLVTMRWWDDLWLNESFATYEGNRAVAEATRFTRTWARFASGKAHTYAQDQLPSTHPISADIVDTDAVRLHFDGITYGKGAAVMKQLAAWVGRDAFDAGIRSYFDAHAWGNATLADFLEALATASGRDLGAWSKEWLETAGVNVLRPQVDVGDDGRYRSVAIEQVAPPLHPTLRSHRAAVGVYDVVDDALVRRAQIELDVAGERTAVPDLEGERSADLLLINDDDAAYARVRLDERSARTVVERLSTLGDEVTRAVVWASTWDMVRDAELTTSDYVDLVVRHGIVEPDLAAVQTLVGQASMAVGAYGHPSKRDGYRRRLAELARRHFDAAEPGSEEQLVWARFWIGFDRSEGGHADMRALLDGRFAPEGLAVDVDLRWQIVGSLVVHGGAGKELVAAEVDRDPSDIGRRRGAAIEAARPDADAKEEAWRRATEAVDEPLATRRTVGGSMWAGDQEDILRPFVGRYVSEMPGWFESMDMEVAISMCRALLPSSVREPATVEALQTLLDRDDLPAPARRIVGDSVDSMERALRAQAADA